MILQKLRFLLLILFLLLTVSIFADDIKFKHLTIDNGLSQNTVNSIFQDHKGVIWIATWDGLNKYDGYDFVVYRNNARDNKSLSDNRINAIIEDRKNNIWIGTLTGLNLFDRASETFKVFESKSKKSYAVFGIIEDKQSNLWLATDEGLKFFNPAVGNLIDVNLGQTGNDIKVQSLYLDNKDCLWIGRFSGLVFYNIKEKRVLSIYQQLRESLKKSWIRAIKSDNDGSVWLGTEADGAIHFNAQHQIVYYTEKTGLLSNTVRDILIVDANEVWIGTKFGLSTLNKTANKIKNYTYKQDNPAQNSLSQASIRSIFKDKKGSIWLGTYSGGINIVYNFKENFVYKGHGIEDPAKLSNKEVNGIYEDKDRSLWLATDGGGLNHWNRETNKIKVYKYTSGHSIFNTVKTIYQDVDDANKLWLSTGGGVLVFDKALKTFKVFTVADKLNPQAFIQQYVFESTKQGVWIGTNFDGLYLYKHGIKVKSYQYKQNAKNSINSINVSSVLDDDKKGLWIGHRTDGLNYLDYRTNTISSYKFNKSDTKSISSNGVLCLFNDSKKRLWIGTDGGGLGYFDPKTKEFLTLADENGLTNSTIYSITEDDNGALWLSSNKGLFKLKVSVAQNPLLFKNIKVVNYTVEDGLQSNQFLHHSVYKSNSGELFFGGINGLTAFFPNQISVNKDKPKIIFTDFLVLGKKLTVGGKSILKKSIDESDNITLPYDQAYFTFKFASLSFIYPEKNKYAFMLEGLANDSWHYVDDQRQATYTNLDPGIYTFKVKAANNSGVWNEDFRAITIIITPPWYATWWAYLFYGLFILILLYLFYYFTKFTERVKNKAEYDQYIIKKEQELAHKKLSFFIKISHEIKTPITMIMAPLQKLMAIHENSPSWSQYLNTMNKSGLRLLNLIDQLLDIRKLNVGETNLQAAKGNMVRFVKEIVVVSTNLAKSKNIELNFLATDASIEAWFDRDKMEKIIYNILSNAIKYTPEYGKIVVEVIQKVDSVTIKIIDNGSGISPEKMSAIFTPFVHEDSMLNNVSGTGIGLTFAKELVQLHHGEISVESTPAGKNSQGYTCFSIQIPLGYTYLKNSEIDDNYLQTEDIDNYKDFQINKQRNFEDVKRRIKDANYADVFTILLVEDNEEVLHFLANEFKNDFEVFTAVNGQLGYQKALEIVPDIIISDVMMPVMDGVEMCRNLKENIITSHIPVVLLTARSPLLFKLEGLDNGADEYISKPFNLDLLEVKVWNLIGNRQKMRSRFQKEVFLEPSNITISTFDDKFLEQIIKYIEDHIVDDALNVEDLSSHVGMSRGNLYKKLKALTTKSPVEFIRYIRLKRAGQLLKQHKMYINEVAFMVGFQDVNYFRKCFKEEFEVSPTEYSKRFNKE